VWAALGQGSRPPGAVHGSRALSAPATPATAPPSAPVNPLPLPLPAVLADAVAPVPPNAARAPSARPRSRPSEATLVWLAFRHLRQQHDPAAALAALDEHRRRFPAGALRVEAWLARAEALVELDRPAEAARVLEQLPPSLAAGARRRLGLMP
jgi:hypothetical protein